MLEPDNKKIKTLADLNKEVDHDPCFFLGLPDPLIRECLKGLSPNELAQLARASKELEIISKDPELWRKFLRPDAKSENPKTDFEKKDYQRAYEYWPLGLEYIFYGSDPSFRPKHRVLSDNKDGVLTKHYAKHAVTVLSHYPHDYQALFRLLVLYNADLGTIKRPLVEGFPDSAEESIQLLFYRLFIGQTDDLMLGKIYYEIAKIIFCYPGIIDPLTNALESKLPIKKFKQFMQETQDLEEEINFQETELLAFFALDHAANYGNNDAEIMLSLLIIKDAKDQESAHFRLSRAKENWLKLDSKKYLKPASKFEQDFAFFDYCYSLAHSLLQQVSWVIGLQFAELKTYCLKRIKQTQEEAIDAVRDKPMPKWLTIILKNKPVYIKKGLSNRLGIRDTFLTREEMGELYFKLAQNIVAKLEKIQYPGSSEAERVLLSAKIHVAIILRLSVDHGCSQVAALYKKLKESGAFQAPPSALAINVPVSSRQRFNFPSATMEIKTPLSFPVTEEPTKGATPWG